MRIAIVAEVFLPKIDGVVGRTLNLIRELKGRGDEVIVVCSAVREPRTSPVPLIECPGFPCVSYPEYIIGRPDEKMAERLQQFQPDVIHFLNPFAFGFQVFDQLTAVGFHRPCLFSFHTLYGEFVKGYPFLKLVSRLLWWLMKSYHNAADRNLSVSSAVVRDLQLRGFQRVELWPPAVDTSLFHPSRRNGAMRRRLSGRHQDRPLLLTVSRLAPEKNVAFLTSVLDRLPGVALAIVGGGPQQDELKRRFSSYAVEFIGYLKGTELAEAYASADAFVYASETETMGNVILESLACGLPVVAADAGGVPSLMTQDVNGFLYPPRDSRSAAEYVSRLLTDHNLRRQMSAAARNSVADRTWHRAAEAVRLAYQQAIDEFAGSQPPSLRHVSRSAQLCTKTLVQLFRLAEKLRGDGIVRKSESGAPDSGAAPASTTPKPSITEPAEPAVAVCE